MNCDTDRLKTSVEDDSKNIGKKIAGELGVSSVIFHDIESALARRGSLIMN